MRTLYERFTKDMGGAIKHNDVQLEARWKASDFGNKGGVTLGDLIKLDKMREAWQVNWKKKSTAKS